MLARSPLAIKTGFHFLLFRERLLKMSQARGERSNYGPEECPQSSWLRPLPISYAASVLSKLFCVTFDTVALIITITRALQGT